MTILKQIAIQLIGFIAMFLTIFSYQNKRRSLILITQYSGNALWCLHYFLLGSYTGLVINALNVARGIIFSIDKKWAKNIAWVFIFCASSIILGILTYKNVFSLLPILATQIATCALYIKQENTLRKVYIFSVPPWIVYNSVCHSLSGTLSSTFTLVSLIVAIIRFEKKKTQQKNTDDNNENSNASQSQQSENKLE